MMVKNRRNELVELDITKIRTVVEAACGVLEGCDPRELEMDAHLQFYDGIATRTIQDILIRVAVEKTSVAEPNWTYVAARLLMHDVYQEVALNREVSVPYENFVDLANDLVAMNRWDHRLITKYSEHELVEAGMWIDADRDKLFTYPGLKHVVDRYLVRDIDNHLYELPQESFLGVALFLAIPEEKKNRLAWARKFYDILSNLYITMATPTFANARKPHGQLSSCFIDTVEDSLTGIFQSISDFAAISKQGGGMGVYLGKLRASNSAIAGYKGIGGGVIPWIRIFNDTAIAVNQLGQRAGAIAIYLDIWHKDIVDFLDLQTNNGDDRRKAYDVFPGVCMPDAFYKAVVDDAIWYLMDPNDVEIAMEWRLEDTWGIEWEERYQQCIASPLVDKVEIPAAELMELVLRAGFETGKPFIFNRDIVNRMNPNKHRGMIYCSNLCTEIAQNMSPTIVDEEQTQLGEFGDVTTTRYSGDFVVCNLSSINLGRTNTLDLLSVVIPIQVRLLDNVITMNNLPVPMAKLTNMQYRAIGIGASGYHQHLVQQGIAWESDAHLVYADTLFEHIAYEAIMASMRLAEERGAYPLFKGSDWATGAYFEDHHYASVKWEILRENVARHGLRNGYLLAIAPTGSTSIIAGSTASIDPVFDKVWIEEKKGFSIPQVAPNLTPNNAYLYKPAHTINQLWSVKAAGVRQKHIDQSQSFNLYLPASSNVTLSDIFDYYYTAWKCGVKTVYYVRTQEEVKDMDINCIGCES